MSTYLRGGFNWHLNFFWEWLPPKDRALRLRDPTSTFTTPAIAGGLFAIDRNWFLELGTYDMGNKLCNNWFCEDYDMNLLISNWLTHSHVTFSQFLGMNIWGGENIELSWRVWMCGGEMEIVPCSKVRIIPVSLLTKYLDPLLDIWHTPSIYMNIFL